MANQYFIKSSSPFQFHRLHIQLLNIQSIRPTDLTGLSIKYLAKSLSNLRIDFEPNIHKKRDHNLIRCIFVTKILIQIENWLMV